MPLTRYLLSRSTAVCFKYSTTLSKIIQGSQPGLRGTETVLAMSDPENVSQTLKYDEVFKMVVWRQGWGLVTLGVITFLPGSRFC